MKSRSLWAANGICFSLDSFDTSQKEIVRMVMDHVRFQENVTMQKVAQRIAQIDTEVFGMILARTFETRLRQLWPDGIYASRRGSAGAAGTL